jgi:Rrf2 family protein
MINSSSAGSARFRREGGPMRLTLWTDYALRTLIYLGVKGDSLATIAEIAEGFDISRPHLMKIVNRLGVQGYVETVRGRKGGIKLARPPAQIRVGAVVRDTEEDLAIMGCLAESGLALIEFRGDGGASHDQSRDEGAKESFAPAPGVVHELEEAEI